MSTMRFAYHSCITIVAETGSSKVSKSSNELLSGRGMDLATHPFSIGGSSFAGFIVHSVNMGAGVETQRMGKMLEEREKEESCIMFDYCLPF